MWESMGKQTAEASRSKTVLPRRRRETAESPVMYRYSHSYCYYYCHCLLFFLNFDVNVNVNDNGSCGCHVNANVNVNWILGSSSSTPSAKLVRCQPSDAVFGRCYCSFDFMAICVSWYSFEDPHQQLFSSSHMSSTFLSTSLSSSTRRM